MPQKAARIARGTHWAERLFDVFPIFAAFAGRIIAQKHRVSVIDVTVAVQVGTKRAGEQRTGRVHGRTVRRVVALVGIDLHKKTISLCLVNQERDIVDRRRFCCCQPKHIVGFLESILPFRVVVDAAANYE